MTGRAGRGTGRLALALEPWVYLSPALVMLGLVMFVPLVVGFTYAFQDIRLLNPLAGGWVGLKNFETLAGDKNFRVALVNTVWWTVGSVALQFLFGLGLAMLLNRAFWGKRLVQAVVFLPWAVPTFLSGLTFAWLLNPVIGPVPHWLFAMGILEEPYNILGNPDLAMWGPIAANVWFGVPFFAITLLAALQAIPSEMYESAAIDGATAWQGFVQVTLPYLAPMIAITVLLRTIWIANFADLIIVMTNGGPANATQILPSYIFTTAYRKLDFGYASAIAMALLLLLFLYAVLLHQMRKVFPEHGMTSFTRPLHHQLALALGHRLGILLYLLVALFPVYWLIKIAVTPEALLYSEGVRLWPSSFTFDNFSKVLLASNFPAFFRNSVIVSFGTAIAVTAIASAAGYAFSRFAFKGRAAIVFVMLLTQMFPLVLLIAPIYRLMTPLGLTDSLIGLIIVYTAFNTPFATFLMQSFLEGIPKELEEAAMIDGCTRPQALIRVILPLTLPGMGATLGFVFTAAWSELLFCLMLINSEAKMTFPVGLLSFVSKFSVDWGQMMAAAVLALIPACIFFAFIQRYLVQGLTAGAVKG